MEKVQLQLQELPLVEQLLTRSQNESYIFVLQVIGGPRLPKMVFIIYLTFSLSMEQTTIDMFSLLICVWPSEQEPFSVLSVLNITQCIPAACPQSF